MLEPPASPLPFDRQRVFGLDLRQHSSLSAYQWLMTAELQPPALIVVPIDADVVLALGEEDIQDAALSATDSLIEAGSGSPLAACLRRPNVALDATVTAAVAVEALIDRYPDVIAYVFACNFESEPEWQAAVSGAMESVNPRIAGTGGTLLPVSAGAPVTLVDTQDPADVAAQATGGGDSGGYVIMSVQVDAPITVRLLEDAQHSILETPHVGLVLLRPSGDTDPSDVGAALEVAPVDTDLLLTGFSNVTLDAITLGGDWQSTRVGTVQYLRTASASATLTVDFVGTNVYVHGVRSPDAGRILAWVDPPAAEPLEDPDITYDLMTEQARDSALPLFTGLSASRHTLVLMIENDEASNVTISGFFVSGSPSRAWIGGLAATSLLLAAVAALSERCLSSISAIRRSSGPQVTGGSEHPRGFARRS